MGEGPSIDWAAVTSAASTVVLVIITAYYAVQTQAMVKEMKQARAAQLMPKIVPSLSIVGPTTAFPSIMNVGTGPALDVDVTLRLDPGGPVRRWRSPVVVAQETHDFFPAEDGSSEAMDMGEMTSKYTSLRLQGSAKDAMGSEIRIDEIAEIRETWELVGTSLEIANKDREKEVADAVKKLSASAERLVRWVTRPKRDDAG